MMRDDFGHVFRELEIKERVLRECDLVCKPLRKFGRRRPLAADLTVRERVALAIIHGADWSINHAGIIRVETGVSFADRRGGGYLVTIEDAPRPGDRITIIVPR